MKEYKVVGKQDFEGIVWENMKFPAFSLRYESKSTEGTGITGYNGDCLTKAGRFTNKNKVQITILDCVVEVGAKYLDALADGLTKNGQRYFIDLDYTNPFDFKWDETQEPEPYYYDIGEKSEVSMDNDNWIPVRQSGLKIYWYVLEGKRLSTQSFNVSGGSGFGGRADRPLNYVWYGNAKFGSICGLAENRWAGDLSKDNKNDFYPEEGFFKTNTPRIITKTGFKNKEDIKPGYVTYYKEIPDDSEIKFEVKRIKNNTRITWKRGRANSDPETWMNLYERAPAVPKVPLYDEIALTIKSYYRRREIVEGQEGLVFADTGFLVAVEEPKENLFTDGSFNRTDINRKKAKNKLIGSNPNSRETPGTKVLENVLNNKKMDVMISINKWKNEFYASCGVNKNVGSSIPTTFPASAYLYYILGNKQNEALSQLWQECSENNYNNKFWYAPCTQEWCHIQGHRSGGPDEYYNFVSGSHYANTEQLAIETAHNQKKFVGNFYLKITVYTLGKSDIALWIRYKIFNKQTKKKVFEHIFDGQSESFDRNEFNILKLAVVAALEASLAEKPDPPAPTVVVPQPKPPSTTVPTTIVPTAITPTNPAPAKQPTASSAPDMSAVFKLFSSNK